VNFQFLHVEYKFPALFGQSVYDGRMLWELFYKMTSVAQYEIIKGESRNHGATAKCKTIVPDAFACKPVAAFNYMLEIHLCFFSGQRGGGVIPVTVNFVYHYGITTVPVPLLIRSYSVECGKVSFFQQEENGGERFVFYLESAFVESAFGMWFQFKFLYDFFCCHLAGIYNYLKG